MKFYLLGLFYIIQIAAFASSSTEIARFANNTVLYQVTGNARKFLIKHENKTVIQAFAEEYTTGEMQMHLVRVGKTTYLINQDGEIANLNLDQDSKIIGGLEHNVESMIYIDDRFTKKLDIFGKISDPEIIFLLSSKKDVILVRVSKNGDVHSYNGFGKWDGKSKIDLNITKSKQFEDQIVVSANGKEAHFNLNIVDGNFKLVDSQKSQFVELTYNLFSKNPQSPDTLNKLITESKQNTELREIAQNKPEENSKAPIVDENGVEVKDPEEYIKKNFGMMSKTKTFSPEEIEALKNNPDIKELRIGLLSGSGVVLGESGSGKTHLAKDFLQAAMNGAFPEIDGSKLKVIILDAATVSQGTKFSGTFATKLNALIQYADDPNVFVFIDELHSLRGAGTHSNDSNDMFEKIKKPVGEGKLKILATDTTAEFYNAFGGDQAIIRRFVQVNKSPPQGEELVNVIENWLAQNKYPKMSRDLIQRAIQHSEDYSSLASQPAKTISPLQRMINERVIDGTQKNKIAASDVDESFRKYYKLDKSFTDVEARVLKLETFLPKIEDELIGMNVFKTKTEDLLFQAESGIHDPNRPLMRGFLSGPRGSGKTYSTVILAKQLGRKWKRIEMNQYSSPHADAKDLLKEVSQALKESSMTVIVFDEFEKANQKIQNAILALLDSGKFTTEETLGSSSNGSKHTVSWDARNAMFFATSNAADEEVKQVFSVISEKVAKLNLPEKEEAAKIHELLAKALPEENYIKMLVQAGISEPVLDRFHFVLPVFPATKYEFRKILKIELNTAIREFEIRKKFKIKIENLEEFIKKIIDTHYVPNVSNRFAIKLVQSEVRSQIAKHLIKNKATKDFSLVLDMSNIKKSSICSEGLKQENEPIEVDRTPIGYKPDYSKNKPEPKPLGYKLKSDQK